MPNVASRNRSRVHLGVPRRPCPRALLAVILVNQMTTKYDFVVGDGVGGRKTLLP